MIKVVIVGGGVAGHVLLKKLSKSKSLEITMVTAQDFKELPWGGPVGLSEPSEYLKYIDTTPTAGCNVIVGTAVSANGSAVMVQPSGEGATMELPYDYLVAATGFSLPLVITDPGQSLADRQAALDDFYTAATGGGDVVIGGGGVTAMEVAGNICEAMAQAGNSGRLTVVSSHDILGGYPDRIKAKAKEVLDGFGATVITEDRVVSHDAPLVAPDKGSRFTVKLKSGKEIPGVAAYLPSFVKGPNTEWLSTTEGALDERTKKVAVDEFLRCQGNPKVFAIGGCALIEESFLGVAKIDAQAATVAANIANSIKDKPLKAHVEGPMANGPLIQVGRHTYFSLVPEVMGCPGKLVWCCGPPCNLLCPCVCCAALCLPCGGCCACPMICGYPCSNPGQSKATATAFVAWMDSSFYAKDALGWKGLGPKTEPVGGAPMRSSMARK